MKIGTCSILHDVDQKYLIFISKNQLPLNDLIELVKKFQHQNVQYHIDDMKIDKEHSGVNEI